jgi:hypothetical protein
VQCSALAFCQLVAITSGQQTTTNITRPRQICGEMEPNGAIFRYVVIEISCILVVMDSQDILANIAKGHHKDIVEDHKY